MQVMNRFLYILYSAVPPPPPTFPGTSNVPTNRNKRNYFCNDVQLTISIYFKYLQISSVQSIYPVLYNAIKKRLQEQHKHTK